MDRRISQLSKFKNGIVLCIAVAIVVKSARCFERALQRKARLPPKIEFETLD